MTTLNVDALVGMIPVAAATGVMVSVTKSMLTEKDDGGKRIRKGKYIVKVTKGNDTKFVGPFTTKVLAEEYIEKVEMEFPTAKVSIVK